MQLLLSPEQGLPDHVLQRQANAIASCAMSSQCPPGAQRFEFECSAPMLYVSVLALQTAAPNIPENNVHSACASNDRFLCLRARLAHRLSRSAHRASVDAASRVLAEKHAEAKAADLPLFNEAIDAASASDEE
jgi:hypothetical protein